MLIQYLKANVIKSCSNPKAIDRIDIIEGNVASWSSVDSNKKIKVIQDMIETNITIVIKRISIVMGIQIIQAFKR